MRPYWNGLHIEEVKAVVIFFPNEVSTPCLVHLFIYFKDFVEVEPKSTCVDIDSRGPI